MFLTNISWANSHESGKKNRTNQKQTFQNEDQTELPSPEIDHFCKLDSGFSMSSVSKHINIRCEGYLGRVRSIPTHFVHKHVQFIRS